MSRFRLAVVVGALCLLSPLTAGAIDLHAFWDSRCADCHGHAGHAMLLAQATTPMVYQNRCESCHKTAAEFVRGSLERKNGVIVGRSSRQPIERFLQRHGGLQPQEIAVVVDSLTRIFDEVHGAPAR